jgi:hypothetical protein
MTPAFIKYNPARPVGEGRLIIGEGLCYKPLFAEHREEHGEQVEGVRYESERLKEDPSDAEISEIR